MRLCHDVEFIKDGVRALDPDYHVRCAIRGGSRFGQLRRNGCARNFQVGMRQTIGHEFVAFLP